MDIIYVAELNNGQVVGVSQLKRDGFVPGANLIEIESFDESLLGQTYEKKKKAFIAPSSAS